MKIYKPTQKELDNYDTRSTYCEKAANERRKLCNERAVVNKYSDCGVTFSKEFLRQKEIYLNTLCLF